MITPLVSRSGEKLGFVAGESVFDTRGRTLGKLSASHVVTEKGTVIGDISGDILTLSQRPVHSLSLPHVVLKWLGLRIRILREGVLSPNS